jgi:hypothetical protein
MKRATFLGIGLRSALPAVVLVTVTFWTSDSFATDAPPGVDEFADVAVYAVPLAGGAAEVAGEELPAAESRYAIIYSNSGNPSDPFLVTRPGAGCSGLDISDVQTALGLAAQGFNCSAAGPNAVADDFVVPTGYTWTINEIVFYFFQTNAPGTTISDVKLRVQTGNPLGGTVPTLTTYTPTTTYSSVYKNLDTDAPGTVCNRRVQQCVVSLATPYELTAGTYYLLWEATGSPSWTGPWQPPVVIPGATQKPGANGMYAMNSGGGVFQPANDPGSSHAQQDFVFVFRGSVGTTWSAGDLDCNGVVNFDDISPFVLALSSHAEYQQAYPNCEWTLADCNGDGYVDFDDINAFVAILSGGAR